MVGVETKGFETVDGWEDRRGHNRALYGELLVNMFRREIKGRYSQTFLGLGWALIQPFIIMVAFTLVFSRLAKVSSEGAPYPLFSYSALLPWTFFASGITAGTFSIAAYRSLVTRIYFPRIILPVAEVATRLVDFFVAAVLYVVLMAIYHVVPTWWVLLLPVLLVIQLFLAIGVTFWTSALYAFYRDIGPVVQLALQVWLLLSPVAYPLSAVPAHYRALYLLNPMAGLVDGYRSILVFGRPPDAHALGIALAVTGVVFLGGYAFFRQLDRYFADVI